jgi:hypothetical protein
MITIEDIKNFSKPHPIGDGGRMTNIFNNKYELVVEKDYMVISIRPSKLQSSIQKIEILLHVISFLN